MKHSPSLNVEWIAGEFKNANYEGMNGTEFGRNGSRGGKGKLRSDGIREMQQKFVVKESSKL